MTALPLPARLLVFDLDGTLIDSEQDLAAAVNATLGHLGRAPLPTPTIRGYIGDGASTLLRRALNAQGAEGLDESEHEAALAYFLAHYREHKLDQTRLYPGVLETLRRLQVDLPNALMAVLTNKPVRPSREICAGLGIAPFFFQIYGGESFARKKPDPCGLLTLMQEASARRGAVGRAAVRPEHTVMIGDSAIDVATADAAGARSIGCTFGIGDPAAVRLARPTAIAQEPTDWLYLLIAGWLKA